MNNGGIAIIDLDDVEKTKPYAWNRHKNYGYPIHRRQGEFRKKSNIFLHHLIMGRIKGLMVDHINHNTLDNRKINLRHVTHSQNMRNRIISKDGICERNNGQWRARITFEGKVIHLGHFRTRDEALASRFTAEKLIFGEYAINRDALSKMQDQT